MSNVLVRPGMDLPSLPAGHRIEALLRARLPEPAGHAHQQAAPHAFWSESFFDLDKVSLFRQATAEQKTAILERCGRGLLEEAYFIEKSGVSFAGEMILLGHSIEERMLYGCFAAEEARHFHQVRSFLQGPLPEQPQNMFLDLLSSVIACADRSTLQFVIQIVLEGWGLLHYRALRDGCSDEALRTVLDGILHDEAGHHGSGRVLFGASTLEDASARQIEEVVAKMLHMVRLGPQAVLYAVDAHLGGLSREQRIQVLTELDAPLQSRERLGHLRQLMRFESVRPIVERLEAQDLFTPLSPEACV